MYEIIDKSSERCMYIHIPYTQRSECKMRLDRFNWEKEYGYVHPTLTFIHMDGDYRNCDVENLYPLPVRGLRRLNKLVNDYSDREKVEFGLAVYELISRINELKGYDFYASKLCEIRRQNDPMKHEQQIRRRRDWYRNNIALAREMKRRNTAQLRKDPEWVQHRREQQRRKYDGSGAD